MGLRLDVHTYGPRSPYIPIMGLGVHTYGPRSPYIPIMGLGVHLYGPAISVGFIVDTYGP